MNNSWIRPIIFAMGIALSAGAFQMAWAHVRISTDLNWSEDVRPIFEKNCMSCHSPGGIAPDYIDLTTYGNEPGHSGARDWAKAIEEEIMTGRMPPWPADERFGHFANERYLTEEEEEYIIAWIQGGAPQGPRRDLPAPPQFQERDWNLGQPDVVVAPREAHEVPSAMNEQTVSFTVPVDLEEDQWITAYEFFPGVPQIVHTIEAYIHDPEGSEPEVMDVEVTLPYDPLADEDELEEIRQRQVTPGPHLLGQWVRGDEPVLLPQEAGRRLRKGSTIELRVTYRKQTYEDQGKAFTDLTRLGLHFSEELPDLIFEGRKIENSEFTVPAGEEAFEVKADYLVEEDLQLRAFYPKMNHLGRKLKLEALYPDGEQKTLLLIPEYHQKWDASYWLEEPVPAPAGTKILLTGTYNNSPGNWDNPNSPPIDVASGSGPGEEQLVVWLDTTPATHLYVPPPAPTPDPEAEENRGGMLAFDFNDQGRAQRETQPEVGAIFSQLLDEEIDPDAAAPAGEDAESLREAAREIAGVAETPAARQAGTGTAATASDEGPGEDEDTVYWCPMRGTAEGQCGLHDYHEPGNCPVCGMKLRPRSFFLKRYEGQLAERRGEFKLTKAGAEDVYWCVNRGRDDHELIDYDKPGQCPVDGLPLVHKSRFEPVRTYTCINEACPEKGMIFYSPGLCPVCQEPVQSMGHMDHNPVHGGQLIMADNLYHHIEGTLPAADTFRMYFYNDWKEPIDPRNFAGKVIVERWDPDLGDVIVNEYPLEFGEEGDEYLTAELPEVEEFPVNFDTLVYLAGEETLFSFAFEGVTEEPAQAEAPAMRLHAHTEREPVVIPETREATIREILDRAETIRRRIENEDWFGLHNPAFDAKDFAEALEQKEEGLGPRERGKLRDAVNRITQGAIFLDRAGDAQDGPRSRRAFETFSEGVDLLRELLPEE